MRVAGGADFFRLVRESERLSQVLADPGYHEWTGYPKESWRFRQDSMSRASRDPRLWRDAGLSLAQDEEKEKYDFVRVEISQVLARALPLRPHRASVFPTSNDSYRFRIPLVFESG